MAPILQLQWPQEAMRARRRATDSATLLTTSNDMGSLRRVHVPVLKMLSGCVNISLTVQSM